MDNTYKPLLPNNKIKTFRINTDDNNCQEKRIHKLFSDIKNNKFQIWLNSPLKERYINNNGKWSGKYMYNNNNDVISVKSYVNEFIKNLTALLSENDHSINNNKLFRDTVASYIYKLSSNNE